MDASRRGKWDRGVTGGERREGARKRLLDATMEVLAAGGVTATEIVQRAGVGRNTFYEHFESVDDAVSEVLRDATARARAVLRDSAAMARTPKERLRALALAWLTELSRSRVLSLSLRDANAIDNADAEADASVDQGVSALMRELESELRAALQMARTAGTVGLPDDPVRVACLLGAFTAAAQYVSVHAGSDARGVADTLADVAVRAFR